MVLHYPVFIFFFFFFFFVFYAPFSRNRDPERDGACSLARRRDSFFQLDFINEFGYRVDCVVTVFQEIEYAERHESTAVVFRVTVERFFRAREQEVKRYMCVFAKQLAAVAAGLVIFYGERFE